MTGFKSSSTSNFKTIMCVEKGQQLFSSQSASIRMQMTTAAYHSI